MSEYNKAWQCMGCGRIESQHTCIGICDDRPVVLVSASDYDRATEDAALAQHRLENLRLFLQQFVRTSPNAGEWERSYRALQDHARRVLAETGL